MAEAALKRMTLDDFLAFEARHAERHEFVDGSPRAMVGGTIRHNLISIGVAASLRARLRGGPCIVTGTDIKILIPNGNVRYPDAGVIRVPVKGRDMIINAPALVVEVLSPSTNWHDQTDKLDYYQSIPALGAIVHLTQDRVFAELRTRTDGSWVRTRLADPAATIPLGIIGTKLPLAEVYDGIALDEAG